MDENNLHKSSVSRVHGINVDGTSNCSETGNIGLDLTTRNGQKDSENGLTSNQKGSLYSSNDNLFHLPTMEDLVRKDLSHRGQEKDNSDLSHRGQEKDNGYECKHDGLSPGKDHHTVLPDYAIEPLSSANPESQEPFLEPPSQDIRNCEVTDQNDSEMSERSFRTQINDNENSGNAQVDEENIHSCSACEDICLEDFEMAELSDSHNADLSDSESEIHQVSESVSSIEKIEAECDISSSRNDDLSTQDESLRAPACVLRHRLEPEPPRSESTDPREEGDEIKPKSSKEVRKLAEIQKALDADPMDIESLRRLAISPGGLINKRMRQQVWPLLINANTKNIPPKPDQEEMEAMTKTYNQVVMDVNRSSGRFPPGIDDHVRMSLKDKLVDLIMRVMLHHKGHLKYYQGFHDVCVTFLLCMDEDMSFAMVNKLAIGYMREYLDETMERTSLLLSYIYPLVNRCNPELCEHMQRNDLGTIFALSWVITWFSHVLGDIKRILRVFDFFLASHRMMPVYLSAAFVLHRERDIFDAGDEMGYIHKCLSVIPPDLPLESLLERAGDLFLQFPPTEISQDPMLIRLNNQVYEHFNLIERRNARRLAQQQEASNQGNRLFVRITLWSVTAVVGVAVAVLYHTYYAEHWTAIDPWNSLS